MKYQSFREFWPFYVGEHHLKLTRIFHFIGTLSVITLIPMSFFYDPYLLLIAPVTGYGFAWFSHYFIEKNRPATFIYPVWSLIADFKMFALMFIGKMDAEADRYSQQQENR
jgi:hypothetical protein